MPFIQNILQAPFQRYFLWKAFLIKKLSHSDGDEPRKLFDKLNILGFFDRIFENYQIGCIFISWSLILGVIGYKKINTKGGSEMKQRITIYQPSK